MPRSVSLPRKNRKSAMHSEQSISLNSGVLFAVTIRSEVAMKRNCCTCLRRIENEDAPVLTMGAYGTPKVLCDDCAALVETITLGKDYDGITAAMQELTDVMSSSNVDDRVTVETVTVMLEESAKRAQKIKEGTYDFALDDVEEGFDEIPEELQETEEDRLLDEKEKAASERFDKFMNWAWIAVGIVAGAFLIWKIVEKFI